MSKNKLALGTVQFGIDYGISNQKGQVQAKDVSSLLLSAKQKGVDILDTAVAYGVSEQVLGQTDLLSGFKIVSKIPRNLEDYNCSIENVFFHSLKKLNLKRLYGYLFHSVDTLRNNLSYWDELQILYEKGLVDKIGVSVSSLEDLKFILKNKLELSLIQLPYNILDNRFLPFFEELKRAGVEIHTRSTFLQGLYFLNDDEFSDKLIPLRKYVDKIREIAIKHKISIADLALQYVNMNPLIDKIVIGVTNSGQLLSNINSIGRENIKDAIIELSSLQVEEKDIDLINPVNWT